MTPVFVGVLALAAWLIQSPARGPLRRARSAFGPGGATGGRVRRGGRPATTGRGGLGLAWGRRKEITVSLTVVVQQLAALLKGGRSPSRLWDELWQLYVEHASADDDARQPRFSPGSAAVLSAARGAALRGAPVADAIRSASSPARHGAGDREPRIWAELAACFDIAAASGCPLAVTFRGRLTVPRDFPSVCAPSIPGAATTALMTTAAMTFRASD